MGDNIDSLKDPEAIGHIELLQGIINRMAGNSANCKAWAITVIVAVFALSDTEGWTRFFICLGATSLFYLLDCFYLGLERRFIRLQRIFVRKSYGESLESLKEECDNIGIDPSKIKPYIIEESTWKDQLKGLWLGISSLSTSPLYVMLVLLPLVFVYVKSDDNQDRPESIEVIYPQTVIVSPQHLNIDQTKQDIDPDLSSVKYSSEHE